MPVLRKALNVVRNYMRILSSILIFGFLLLTNSFTLALSKEKSYSVEITFSPMMGGPRLKYSLNENSVKVDILNNLDNNPKKTIYLRRISQLKSNHLISLLRSLNLDTLRGKIYQELSVSDAVYIDFKINLPNHKTIDAMTYAFETPVTKILITTIENMILNKKCRFWNLYQQ